MKYRIIPILALVAACSSPAATDEAPAADNTTAITTAQFASAHMAIGTAAPVSFEQTVDCNGYIQAPAQATAQVGAPTPGLVRSVECNLGSYVQKGQVLCTVAGNEFLAIQQEFAEISAQTKKLKTEYERIKALWDEKIGSEKELQAAEAEYRAARARYAGLKLRIGLLNLSPAKIEAGELAAAYPLVAPTNGYITALDVVLGQYVEPQAKLVEIVDTKKLQLNLSVFEQA